ncbi:nucleotidyltransferase [Devosia sp. Root413D1]|uniref:nucleotidyltransferase domain-containing protein n=1 Tax=Devosia sp. Root413D1 TaxID=1736531 RepID=UPI0006F3C56F|nr:nucleotidyltransferase domain-containing protein [Devosia sp. Root413D1]KQW86152.1 nucleotidyltransferase [Devosia sp. Root413D1]
MNEQNNIASHALAAAEVALASRFAGAACAFVAGSIMRGEGTIGSDIDLVVLFPRLERAWRESFVADDFPIEAFVHDPETLAYYLDKDIESGRPIMLDMVTSGVVIGPQRTLAEPIRATAARALAAGPRPLDGPAYDTMRYMASDLIDDLRGRRPPAEIAAIAAQLHPRLIDLMLLGRGAWTGAGKWGPRLLRRLDGQLADRFDAAFRTAALGDGAALMALAEAELGRHGGHCFDGYKQQAPLDARIPSGTRDQ